MVSDELEKEKEEVESRNSMPEKRELSNEELMEKKDGDGVQHQKKELDEALKTCLENFGIEDEEDQEECIELIK